MPTTLTATHRIVLTYTVSALSHICRQYVKVSGSSTPYGVILADASSISFADAAQGLWDAIKRIWSSAVHASDVTAELQERSGLIWNPIEFGVVINNAGGGNVVLGAQTTIVLRHSDFTKSKVILMEGGANTPSHYNTDDPAGDYGQIVAAEFTVDAVGTNPPVQWVVSRSNQYLLDHGVAGVTQTYNRKIRRARGML